MPTLLFGILAILQGHTINVFFFFSLLQTLHWPEWRFLRELKTKVWCEIASRVLAQGQNVLAQGQNVLAQGHNVLAHGRHACTRTQCACTGTKRA